MLVLVLWSALLLPFSFPVFPQDEAADVEIDEIRESVETYGSEMRKHRREPRLRVSTLRDLMAEVDYAKKPAPDGFGYDGTQVEAMEVLVAEAISEALEDEDFAVRELAIESLTTLGSPSVPAYLFETVLAERKEKDMVKKAATARILAHFGYTDAIEPTLELLDEKEDEVRLGAIIALGEFRDPRAVPALLEMLEDRRDGLRIAAIDALVGIDQRETTVPALLELIEGPEWPVRARAIQSLGKMRHPDSVGPLMDLFVSEKGRLREDIVAALVSLTGYDFEMSVEQWTRWWDRNRDGFRFPSDEEMAKRKERSTNVKIRRYDPLEKATAFAELPTVSKRMIFTIDVSGSMEELIADRENFKLQDRGYRSFQKMEIVKEELIRTIEALDSDVRFNVIAFATEVDMWKKQLVPATGLTKKQAIDFVRSLEPIGGASQSFKGRAGLRGASNTDAGRTNTFASLMASLGADPGKGYDIDVRAVADTVFFLSDGQPTVGEYVDPDEIRQEVQRVNKYQGVVIHTIAIGNFEKAFMEALAAQNGGVFVDLSPNEKPVIK